jgi:O-6-methylguanine DNA methyltransferase
MTASLDFLDDQPGALAALRVPAPADLPDRVLVDVGLADRHAPIDSPLGRLWVAWNGRGVSLVDVATDADTFVRRHEAVTGRRTLDLGPLPLPLASAISRRLGGDRSARVALDLRGHSAFEQAVWMKALEIPRGQVRPYGWIAAEIGRPKAVRAVGTALGHNPVPLIVPCHRVVRTDGLIGQYSLGGPQNKRTILAAEGLDPDRMEADARRGIRYVGSDTTRIMCLPTCHHAKRVTDAHRIPLRSYRDGLARGYRACKVCRPDSGGLVAA